MAKLTNTMRDIILNKLIDKRFKKDWEKISKKKLTIGEKAYQLFVEPHVKTLEKLPSAWVIKDDGIKVMDVNYSGNFYPLKEKKILPRSDNTQKYFRATKTLSKLIAEVYNAENKLQEEIRKLRGETYSTLQTFNSTKKLKEFWPEVTPLIPTKTVHFPIAISIINLNKKLQIGGK